VRRRFAPHQLRHAHAVEIACEGVPLIVIQARTRAQQPRHHLCLPARHRQRRDHRDRARPTGAHDPRQRLAAALIDCARAALVAQCDSASPKAATVAFRRRCDTHRCPRVSEDQFQAPATRCNAMTRRAKRESSQRLLACESSMPATRFRTARSGGAT
jgi:hypothetical protein